MEIKEKQQIKKDTRKIQVNIDAGNFISKIISFYKNNIAKIHIVIAIICALLFLVTFFGELFKYKNGEITVNNSRNVFSLLSSIKDNAFYSFVVILAGITPYFYLSAIGIFYSAFIAERFTYRCVVGASLTFTSVVGGIVYCIGSSLCIAIGLYLCYLSSKKRKYYNKLGYTFDDVHGKPLAIKTS